MVSGSAPYLVENPRPVRDRWERCPPAGLRRSATPRWHLERWKRVRELISGWYNDVRPGSSTTRELIDRLCGDLDPVQTQVVTQLFGTWTAMFPDAGDAVDLDPPAMSVFDHERRIELTIRPTVSIRRGRETEHIRLRTGRTLTGPDEASVLTDGAAPNQIFVDAMVGAGVAEEIVPPSNAALRIEELFELADRDRRTSLAPGRWCVGCDSAARCGQYPAEQDSRVFVSTRSLVVSKTDVGLLHRCQRRVAWARLHQLPVDDGDRELDDGWARVLGTEFHQMVAAATNALDPDAAVDLACSKVEPAQASELRRLWSNHLHLMKEEENLPKQTEYPVGATFVVDGVHVDRRGTERRQPVAITAIGILDLTGRESDGTPLIIEHRTGARGGFGVLEAELYAVGAARRLASHGEAPDRVAVHAHHLSPHRPSCERVVFDGARLAQAAAAIREVAVTIANWHPENALQPTFEVGQWCGGCPYLSLCSNHRR